ncbi:MAG: amidohydrolase family protein [Lentisphaeria bacterium]|nr:amidohydrolase family protein [Lentisphaeria bacterium]
MEDIFFFDANVRVGFDNHRRGASTAELLADMEHYGIERALVRSRCTACSGALIGNRQICKELAQDTAGKLTGVWCVLPSQCDDMPEPDEFFAAMKANNIGALTIEPFDHRYIPCRLTLGKILGAAAERKIPVLLHAFQHKWEELYRFMAEFPELTCIFNAGHKWGTDRNIRPLLENYPNCRAELAGYWVPEGIADLAKIYGAERLVYGSGFPKYNHGSGMLQLKHSTLSEKEIAMIAGKNLEELLKGAEL